MKAFTFALISTIIHVEGFAPSGVGSVHRSISSPLFNHHSNDDAVDNNDVVKFVAALTLAGGMMFAAPGAVFAETTVDNHFNNIGGGSSVVISGSVQDSDIADFSMPSYAEASRAAVNSNMKGDTYLLGEASKNFMSSSGPSAEAPKTEVVSAVDAKAEKEAAKAAMKAARANQIAASEAAAKAAAE